MNERIKSFYEKYDIWIMMGLILAVFAVMSVLEPMNEKQPGELSFPGHNRTGCFLEYSQSVCQDGEILTIFHNPSEVPIKKVKLIVPDKNGGKNIYKPGSPLPSNETSYLNTGSCKAQDMGEMKLGYCCGGNCTVELMENPSEDLSMKGVNDG